jgi:hypothetical protein
LNATEFYFLLSLTLPHSSFLFFLIFLFLLSLYSLYPFFSVRIIMHKGIHACIQQNILTTTQSSKNASPQKLGEQPHHWVEFRIVQHIDFSSDIVSHCMCAHEFMYLQNQWQPVLCSSCSSIFFCLSSLPCTSINIFTWKTTHT